MARIKSINGFSGTQTGPRGGRYYISKAGTKVYGTPPASEKLDWGALRQRAAARGAARSGGAAAPAPPPPKPAPPPKAPPKPKPAKKEKPVSTPKERKPVVAIKPVPPKPHALPEAPKPVVPPPVKKPIAAIAPPKPPAKPKSGGFNIDQHAPVLYGEHYKPELARAIKTGGFDKILEKHPLKHVEFVHQSSNRGGDYASNTGVIRLNTEFKPHPQDYKIQKAGTTTWSPEPNVGWTKGNTAKLGDAENKLGARQYVAIHELSHHLHYSLAKEAFVAAEPNAKFTGNGAYNLFQHDVVNFADKARGHGVTGDKAESAHLLDRIVTSAIAAKKGRDAVSQYARTNHKEWFAETHSAYVLHNAELKEARPRDHKLMQDVRKYMGME